MTIKAERSFVTIENFESRWDALWRGWYTNQQKGEFRIRIERLGQGPHATVEVSDRDIAALREKFGPAFDPEERAAVVLNAALEINDPAKGRVYSYDMVATRENRSAAIFLQAIGESVRLSIRDKDWTACRERLGIGHALEGESEEGE